MEAAKEIRLFGTGALLRERMRRDRTAINATRRRMELRTAAAQGLPAAVSAGIAAAGLLWAVRAAARGERTAGDLAVLTSAIAAVQGGLSGIAASATVARQHLLPFEHYLDLTSAPPDLPVPRPARPVGELTRGIELRDVWFRYSEQHDWVLRGVNLTLPRGRTLALVGANGAGKSTLVKLLCRLYDPSRGSILWDGTDIRELDPAELRRRVGAVRWSGRRGRPVSTTRSPRSPAATTRCCRGPTGTARRSAWSCPAGSGSGWRRPGPSCGRIPIC
ncbi:hypothetical protein GCM10010260_08260 [Streptomyces filipinensis]|uniref:ABC transmembrane type-1 domain-containing protein n=1 Tax=Streptomyces filipinensis TaxID=66887 RepID=A0A918I686_9ACTN|nr:ATP-binding cassette domain-containing protein [Streptomyces filipinensis]GGU78200.1 hypothetical protein GCM10010260_08260 [Streptomyces filipinensis]